MTSLLITGYKSFELGVFKDKDPKVNIIKKAIKRDLKRFLDEGVDWMIFTGNLGFEFWALEVAKELQKDYPLKLATLFPFETHGQNWNEANQVKLSDFKQVDFIKYAYPTYEHKGQLRDYQIFLLENTDGAYLFYDEENETKLKFFYELMKKKDNYMTKRLTFEDLNEMSENFSEN